MNRVIIESPFRGKDDQDRAENVRYLNACLFDSVKRGEVPFASHGFFTYFLNEDDEHERTLSIRLGFEFWSWAEKIVFYIDRGMSPGMEKALVHAFKMGKTVERRSVAMSNVGFVTEGGEPIPDEVKKFAPKNIVNFNPVEDYGVLKEDLPNKSGASTIEDQYGQG